MTSTWAAADRRHRHRVQRPVPDDHARAAAEEQGVDVRFYDVVYQVTDDIEKAVKVCISRP